MTTTTSLLTLDSLNDLRTLPVADAQLVLVLGVTGWGDGLGGFYRWSAGNTTAEDKPYYNFVGSSRSTAGRWVRVFQRVRTIGVNVLVTNGGFKTLFASGVTDANGRLTVYLTDDGTPAGNALFGNIMQTNGEGTAVQTDPNNIFVSGRYSLSSDLKTLVYQFARGNSSVVSLLGTTVLGMRAAAQGATVSVRIDGM